MNKILTNYTKQHFDRVLQVIIQIVIDHQIQNENVSLLSHSLPQVSSRFPEDKCRLDVEWHIAAKISQHGDKNLTFEDVRIVRMVFIYFLKWNLVVGQIISFESNWRISRSSKTKVQQNKNHLLRSSSENKRTQNKGTASSSVGGKALDWVFDYTVPNWLSNDSLFSADLQGGEKWQKKNMWFRYSQRI